MILAAIALALMHALTVGANAGPAPYEQPNVDYMVLNICLGFETHLTSYSEFEAIASMMPDVGCHKDIKETVKAFAGLLERNKDDLCSGQSIEEFLDFYRNYLDTSAAAINRRLPSKSIRRLAIAYGMQLSNVCKKDMTRVIFSESHKLLGERDFAALERLVREGGPVDRLLSKVGEPGAVLVPSDLLPLLRAGYKKHKIHLQTSTGPYVRTIQTICARRFKPVYEPHMLNINKLANMGFSYRDHPLTCRHECPPVARELYKWTRIVYLCEALDGVQIVDEAKHDKKAKAAGKRTVRVLSEQEAQALGSSSTPLPSEIDVAIPALDYKPRERVLLDNVIYDTRDETLVDAVGKFNTNTKERDLLLGRVARMAWSMIKAELKQGHYGLLWSSVTKGLFRMPVTDPTERLIKSLDELVKNQEVDPSSLLSLDDASSLAALGVVGQIENE